MPETTFACPDLTTFLGLDALGLTAVGQHLTAERTVIECRTPIGFEDPFCKACGAQGQAHGTVARRLAHVPVGWRPTQLLVRLRRFACTHCRRVWRQDTSSLAEPQDPADPLGRRVGTAGPCPGVHVGLPDSSRPGDLLAHRQQRDPGKRSGHAVRRSPPLRRRGGPRRRRFTRALRSRAGGAPSVWRHTRRGDRYVTVMIDLTPVRDRSGPARLVDVVPGRSKKPLQDLALPARPRLAWARRGGSHGRLHRVPRAPPARSPPRPGRSWTPFTSCPSRRQARPVPPPHPTGDHRPAGPSG